jgi:hypothetical protein
MGIVRDDQLPNRIIATVAALSLAVLGFLAHGFFIFFLRAVSNFFGKGRLAMHTIVYFWCYAGFFVAFLAIRFFLAEMPQPQGQLFDVALGVLVIMVGVILPLVFFIAFLLLVGAARRVIGRAHRAR